VDSTVAVALIGAVATVATAIGGYVANYLAGIRLHEANRELAVETHRHEGELAEKAQPHERQLRQGERAYEDRKTTYRRVGTWALVTTQQVQATEPLMRTGQDPEPPPSLSDEEWSDMLIEVGLFGSPEVSEVMEDFKSKVRGFSGHLMTFRNLAAHEGALRGESAIAINNARGEVTHAYERLTGAMRDELASL
jgi:hypothetical protein